MSGETTTTETQASAIPIPTAAQIYGAAEGTQTFRAKLRRLILPRASSERYRRILLVGGWRLVVLAFVLLLPLAYLCWYIVPPHLWVWANKVWWHWLPAIFGFLFLWMPPIWGGMAATELANTVLDLSLSAQESELQKAQQAVRETEEDAIQRLEQTDNAGLLPLLKYSRAQLLAYYQMGLSQAKGSFSNSVIAMWLGFGLLLAGVALFVGPFEKIGLKPPSSDIKTLVMGGAAIIEFVSALFLWVYRSSIGQLTYFYNSQMHSHSSILCFRIAETMETSKDADDAKRAIIDKILSSNLTPERPPVDGAKGLLALLSKGGVPPTS